MDKYVDYIKNIYLLSFLYSILSPISWYKKVLRDDNMIK